MARFTLDLFLVGIMVFAWAFVPLIWPLQGKFGRPDHLLPKYEWRRWLFRATALAALAELSWRFYLGFNEEVQDLSLAVSLVCVAWWMSRMKWWSRNSDRLHDLAAAAYGDFQKAAIFWRDPRGGEEFREVEKKALVAINYLEAASEAPGAHGVNNLGRAEAALRTADCILVRIQDLDEEYAKLEKRRDDLQLYLTIQALGNYPEARAALREVEEALQRNEAVDLNCAAWFAERVRLQTWLANEIDRHHSFCRDVSTTSTSR